MASGDEWFWAMVDRAPGPDTCWLWTGRRHAYGYGRLHFDGADRFAHRVAWTLVHGDIEPGVQIMRRCRNRACVRLDHLFRATAAEAGRYRAERGFVARGERHGSHLHPERRARGERQGAAKLTDEQVRQIRARYRVGTSQIWRIVTGQNRQLIPEPGQTPGVSR